MATLSSIKKCYSTCLSNAILWLNKNSYTVFPQSLSIITLKNSEGNIVVKTSEPIHLKNWPERGGSSHKIDILFSLREIISSQDSYCHSANIHVSYFRVERNVATAIESLHYDSDVPPAAKHPVCHAQNSRKHVDKPESFTSEIDSSPLLNRSQNVRIPTAFINLPGILSILSADHMRENEWIEFMNHCMPHFRKVPQLPNNFIIDNQISNGRLAAWNWYALS
jgi:hypothetical protein